jgi:predicted phosphodiesterase
MKPTIGKFISLITLFVLWEVTTSFALPRQIHLSWSSSDKDAAAKTMTITWASDQQNKGLVRYGTAKKLNLSRPATEKQSAEARMYIYTANLKNLKPNKTYYYQCGSDQDGWSEVYTFKTAPLPGRQDKFVVGVWGDTQDNEFNTQFEKTDVIVGQMGKYPVQFTIHMGDIVNTGSQVPSWQRLFQTTEPINARAPFMPVPGNHDVDNELSVPGFQKPFQVFNDLFNLPKDDIDYSFNYGNTHFVAINSGHAKGVEEAGQTNWRYAPDSPEYQWLKADLERARQDKDITWVIVYMHHPLYSYGWSHVKGWQARLTPLLDQYKVDLALAGHRHVYERHKAIRQGQVLSQIDHHVYKKPAGTVYITNGTAGGSPQGLGGSAMPSMVFTSPAKMYNYAIMTIQGKTLTYEVYNETSEKIDYFELSK